MNKVFLIGNLTRDPELSETQSGISVCRFGIAVNKVAVLGNIELRTYEDRDGVERMSVDVIASDVEFLTPKGASDDSGDYSPAPARTERKKPSLQSFDDDGDIPF